MGEGPEKNEIMPPTIESKLPRVGTTIFTVMSSLAAELGAVNLGQGYPDFPMSEELISLVARAMQEGHNQYTHMNGLAGLREVLAEKIAGLYGTPVDPDHPDHHHPRRHLCHLYRADHRAATRRRGDRLRTGLRQLYPQYRSQWRSAGTDRPAFPRLSHRLGRSAPPDNPPDEDDPAQLPAQPDRRRPAT